MGAESQPAAVSRPIPLAQLNTRGDGGGCLCVFSRRRHVCWLTSSAEATMQTLEPKSLLLGNTGASEGEQSRCLPSHTSGPDLRPRPQSTGSNYGTYRAVSENGF